MPDPVFRTEKVAPALTKNSTDFSPMSSLRRGSSGVSWSAGLGAPGLIILHLFGPSAFQGCGRVLPFPSALGGADGIVSSSVPLVYIGTLIGS